MVLRKEGLKMARGVCYKCKERDYPSCYATCEGKLEEDKEREKIKQARKEENMMNSHVMFTRERFTGIKKGKY